MIRWSFHLAALASCRDGRGLHSLDWAYSALASVCLKSHYAVWDSGTTTGHGVHWRSLRREVFDSGKMQDQRAVLFELARQWRW